MGKPMEQVARSAPPRTVACNPMLPTGRKPGRKPPVDEPRHLLIDGYNVLYAWRWLRPGRGGATTFDAARARLAEAVRPIRDVDGYAVTIVFDGRGPIPTRDESLEEPGFDVVFAPADKTADGVIEGLVAAARDPRACTVATADALERETVTASGAGCVTPEELLAWCERSRARASQSAARRGERTRATWGNKLPL
jgi:predicted RNA-binding protein with PIN domain